MSDLLDVGWDLTEAVLAKIFDSLSPKQLARCSSVTKRWKNLLGDDRFQRRIKLKRAWRCEAIEVKRIELDLDHCKGAFKWDDTLIVMGLYDEIGLANVKTGEIIHKEVEMDFVQLIDGMLISISEDGENENISHLIGYSLPDLIEEVTFDVPFNVYCVVDVGDHIAIGGEEGSLGLWRKSDWICETMFIDKGEDPRLLDFWPQGRDIFALGFAEKKGWLVCGDRDGSLQVWSLSSCTLLRTVVKAHCFEIAGLVVASNNLVLTSSSDERICVWDLETMERINVVDDVEMFGFSNVSLNADQFAFQRIVGNSVPIQVWDIHEDSPCRSFELDHCIDGLYLTNEELIVVDSNGDVLVWNFALNIA